LLQLAPNEGQLIKNKGLISKIRKLLYRVIFFEKNSCLSDFGRKSKQLFTKYPKLSFLVIVGR
jgi:hypothetical protein